MVVINKESEYHFYMDDFLAAQLDKAVKIVGEKDEDRIWIVDGKERVGKSVFAMQLAAKVDPNFSQEQIVYTPAAFKEKVLSARKGSAIIFDEAFKGLSSKGSLSRINKLLTSLMMEMGQKNLFVFIVMPTFFELQRYIAIWRSNGLFHVYRYKGKRGYWKYYNQKKKLLLYQKSTNYRYDGSDLPKYFCKGKFFDQYVLDEKLYRKIKSDNLKNAGEEGDTEQADRYLRQRNICFKIIHREFNVSYRDMQNILLKYKVDLKFQTLSKAVKSIKELE